MYVAKGRNRGRKRRETLCIIASEQAIYMYIVISTGDIQCTCILYTVMFYVTWYKSSRAHTCMRFARWQ